MVREQLTTTNTRFHLSAPLFISPLCCLFSPSLLLLPLLLSSLSSFCLSTTQRGDSSADASNPFALLDDGAFCDGEVTSWFGNNPSSQ